MLDEDGMTDLGAALFETKIGLCGVAWGERGVVAMQLPEASGAEVLARLRARAPEAAEVPPPATVQQAIDGVVALLRGELVDLSSIVLDMRGVPAFHQRVYELTRAIAPGQTRSYGEIATALGSPGASRAVGQALGRNPFAPIVPCHRVLSAGRRPGGFSASGGVTTKLKMLELEGVSLGGALPLFAAK